jgi:hypothetical protein
MRAGVAGRAPGFQLAMRARVAVCALAFYLAMRAGVAGRAAVFQLTMRAGVAGRAAVFQLAMRAGVAGRAVGFQLAMRAGVAGRAVIFPLAMRAGVAVRAVAFPLAVRAPFLTYLLHPTSHTSFAATPLGVSLHSQPQAPRVMTIELRLVREVQVFSQRTSRPRSEFTKTASRRHDQLHHHFGTRTREP